VIAMRKYVSFGEFLSDKRRTKEIPSLQMAEAVGLSASYYCDIEKNRKAPPDIDILEKIIAELGLANEDRVQFFDLAGKARSGVAPDLPGYINENEVVRVALRVAKDKASAEDWKQFIDKLENKRGIYDA